MIWIVAVVIFICICLPVIPFLAINIHNVIFYGILDIYRFFRYKKYNEFKDFGYVNSLCGYFGSGKTLSGVKIIVEDIYKKYNGLKVWDKEQQQFVVQHIHIISNVPLDTIPYIPFASERQLIDFKEYHSSSMDITIFLLDEAGAIWNSRNFKSNISHELLTQILQCRKDKMAIYTTSQRFNFQDALIRQITYECSECLKAWRIQKLSYYNAYELENCNNPLLIKPKRVKYWFVKDKHYGLYNTNGLVEALVKKNEEGYFISNEEILSNIGVVQQDSTLVTKAKRKLRKRLQRK